ncbi:MAG: hypothetical protein WCI52_00230 [bacterium]
MHKKLIIPFAAAVIVVSSLGTYQIVNASSVHSRSHSSKVRSLNASSTPVVFGIVEAVNDSYVTISSVLRGATTTYTIDASAAKIIKSGSATTTISDIVVGDKILVKGNISGTNVSAETITDNKSKNTKNTNWSKAPKGFHAEFNGIIGKVSYINGTTISVSVYKKNATTTYTVDASNVTISNIQVGDTIIVRGSVTGTSVIAKSIVESLPPRLSSKK